MRLGPGAANCGTVTGQYMGKLIEDKGNFSRFICTGQLPVFNGKNVLFLVQEGIFLMGNVMSPLFVTKEKVTETSLQFLQFLKCVQLKIINMPQPIFWGSMF